MQLRLATFNVENLMRRFDFAGYRKPDQQDRVLKLFEIGDEAGYRRLEEARMIALADDTRQHSALAIADCDADIVCLQEVDDLPALEAFENGYLYRMMGRGYRRKILMPGNDGRGIDVALMLREETAEGAPIDIVKIRSHADATFGSLGVLTPELAQSAHPEARLFRRDCLEVDLTIGSRPLTLFLVHFKSMGPARGGVDGRAATMPLRRAEALGVRRIIERRFGDALPEARFAICGDMNDYQEKILIEGSRREGYRFHPVAEADSALNVFSQDGFAENVVARLDPMARWTLFHARGPAERHLCQLDYLWLSPALAAANPEALPEIIRAGQPFRTPFPPGQDAERYPRIGWDRPKASDHCPVVMALEI
ncbi:endonuclease [Xaviernesmea oryzae]|uniref:Endonuclease n=1 Tax=Xaviernesmea oryzae TaxID=464029 RepID=A0A1Q9ATD7_9HYPH|nr:endonuclease/exonuclease/phosphatase family protein [Xaviernesmea oryzae]OLP58649.1 endonuclease [Xaviernesmea oryzae]SEK65652.1 Endonuclease/Exonuclease/phosphatase family protein [Xaviernesmea oryzae]